MEWFLNKLRDWVRPRNVYQIDDSYSVEVVIKGREVFFLYREGSRLMSIYGDDCYPFCLNVWTMKKWEPPHQEELLTDERKRAIVGRIQAAFCYYKTTINTFGGESIGLK